MDHTQNKGFPGLNWSKTRLDDLEKWLDCKQKGGLNEYDEF
nr:MAG TPA: hypothetical protein [Caudoviricetes sp.]DAZ06291.1 MAG TPA: hypothetical protein [Caudoviricetes sp.]